MSQHNGKDNLVKFPHVDNLVVSKAVDLLQSKQYDEAIALLEESFQLHKRNEIIALTLLIAYSEAGQLINAKKQAQYLLANKIGDLFRVIDIYISTLLKLEDYEEIIELVESILESQNLSEQNRRNLVHILHESKQLLSGAITHLEYDEKDEGLVVEEVLSSDDNEDVQLQLMRQLSELNIRPHLTVISNFLKRETASPFIKTILIHQLIEQEVDQTFEVVKFDQEITISPLDLRIVHEGEFFTSIKGILQDNIEQDDPTLFDNVLTILEHCAFLTYPFIFITDNYNVWAATLHLFGLHYFGGIYIEESILKQYEVKKADLQQTYNFVQKLESLSSPHM